MENFDAAPSVRALAREQGIDLEKLARDLGRATITRDDLSSETPAQGRNAQMSDMSRYWDVDHSQYGSVSEQPLSRFAQVASANLSAANASIPQVTHHDYADVVAIESFRKSLRPEAQARDVKLTALAFYVRALALTLADFPKFNASLTPDGATLILKNYVHIGVAVDTEHGLMVPVIRNADQKGIWQIAAEITDLATRAKSRKIAPEEMGGGSITVTNLGAIGGTGFSPIVNPPELAILGITRAEVRPVWDGEAFQPTPMVPLDLSYDHRVINGADAARFVSHMASLLADPRRMLI